MNILGALFIAISFVIYIHIKLDVLTTLELLQTFIYFICLVLVSVGTEFAIGKLDNKFDN